MISLSRSLVHLLSLYQTCLTLALLDHLQFNALLESHIHGALCVGETQIVCVQVRTRPIRDGLDAVFRGLPTVYF